MISRSAVLLPFILAGCATAARAPAPEGPIQFLLINDVYVGDTARDGSGGLARVATLKRELARNGPVALFLAGDFISPSLLSKWYRGRQMIEFLNVAGVDYATPGNHEFDFGREILARIQESRFKWISTNCFESTRSSIPNRLRWDTVTIQRTRFGIFGLTVSGSYSPIVPCIDQDSAARIAVRELRQAGAGVIIGLTHLTRAEDSTILANEPAIDFILGGHEHSFQEVTLGNRSVLKADQNARSAQLLTFSRVNGRLTATHRLVQMDRTIPLDVNTQNVVGAWNDTLRRRLGSERVIGHARDSLDARNLSVRRGETNFGNMVTDALRFGTNADVGLLPGGTMRLDEFFAPGPVTNWKIESVFLFASETRIVLFNLTGKRLREIVEHSLSHGAPTGMVVGWGGWLQLSGIRYKWMPRNPVGSRIVGEIQREGDGRPIGSTEMVSVAMSDYQVCQAGDGFVIPEAGEACIHRESAPRAVDLIIGYIGSQPGRMVPNPTLGRITQVR